MKGKTEVNQKTEQESPHIHSHGCTLTSKLSLDSVLIIVNVYRQVAEQPKWITFLSVSVMRVLVLGATIPFL